MKKLLWLAVLLTYPFAGQLPAQTPAAATPQPPPPITLKTITLERASLPGSALPWTKIVVEFESALRWADGIAFSYSAVLSDGQATKLVLGGVRYANIPKGVNRAVMYLSPRAALRYGNPVACKVEAVFKDEEIGELKWSSPNAQVPGNWDSLEKYNGILVSILSTPWLVYDYEKSPDILDLR